MKLDDVPARGMKAGWILIIIILIIIIAVGSIIIWSRYRRSEAVEISIMPEREMQGEIFIGGEVYNPGIYPFETGESIMDIIRVAGGITDRADCNRLELFVPNGSEEDLPQKVNINRAEMWLLEALPGIGEVRAQAIIDYRCQNGPFCSINELVKVEGIGTVAFERIKHLITVAD